MNLIEFIKYIKDEEGAIQYMNEHYPDVDYYEAEVYLKGSLSVESELVIFDGEKIEGMIEMEVDNEKYYNLFTLDLFSRSVWRLLKTFRYRPRNCRKDNSLQD